MLRIEEIVGNVDDDFRDHLLEMDDGRLRALLADSQTLRHLLPMGVSYKEAVTAINAILDYRALPPEEQALPLPPKKKRAPRKKKAAVVEAPLPPFPEDEGRDEGEPPPGPEPEPEPEPEPPPEPEEAPTERLTLPTLRPRRRDHVILLLPVILAAVLVVLLLTR
ncbi:MAG: hypothetical protein Q7R40_15785 [Phaeospirillum sp.]|nr:hypothetical protein [Phaeospirillum sp.]